MFHNSKKYTIYKFLSNNKSIIASFLLVLFVFTITGCGSSYQPHTRIAVKEIPVGKITTDGLVIKAENGSFVLEKGTFDPPFQLDTYNAKLGQWNKDNIKDNVLGALEMGAEKVKVKVPGYDEEFYGVLALSKVDAMRAEGPASRSYLLSVPDTYAANAQGGRTSVVYEPHSLGGGQSWFSWVLWLSDVPFPEVRSDVANLSRFEKEERAIQYNIDRINQQNVARAELESQTAAADAAGDIFGTILIVGLIGALIYGLVVLAAEE